MPGRLFRLYQRKRIINIHVNAVVAGLLAIALAKFPVLWVSTWVGKDQPFLNSVIAYVIDSFFDVVVYFGLHWVANHWNPLKPTTEKDLRHQKAKKPNFLRDVAHVQAERIALVPVFAVVSIGGMWALQKHADWPPQWAFVVAFVVGILTTRVLHTVIGYWTGTFVDHYERPELLTKNRKPNQEVDRDSAPATPSDPKPQDAPEPEQVP